MADNQDRLLDHLVKRDGWVSAAELADQLGVSTRSVRSYVTAIKAASHPLEVVQSSPAGYRVDRDALAEYAAAAAAPRQHGPRDRVHRIVRALLDSADGIDVHAIADELHVSESTVESDLRRVRSFADDAGVRLVRSGSAVRVDGEERARRRMLSLLFRSESEQGFLELEHVQREFHADGLAAFKTDLLAALDRLGFYVNEYGVDSVLLHVAIAVDRVRRDRHVAATARAVDDAPLAELGVELAALARTHFDVELHATDVGYLVRLLSTRVIAPARGEADRAEIERHVSPRDLETVERVVDLVREEYLIDLGDDVFTVRFALHLANLIERARDHSYSRNPLVRSIKTSYPMIYDVAVFIASVVQRDRDIEVNDDEISYIALHIGSHLERRARERERVSCTIVCPGYYDVHQLLRERIEERLGSELAIELVVTRTDVDWSRVRSELVVTTIAEHAARPDAVVVQPFLTDDDVDRVRSALSRIRRQRRRAELKNDLLRYFDESLFVRNAVAADEEAMIRLLGRRMVERGIIDSAYVDGAVERERMSSTAFGDAIAVPHAMTMTATTTSIAVAVNESPMAWGDARVNVIALIAFSEEGRASFQVVFDQLVEVFADRAAVAELVRESTGFPEFIEQLVHLIDA